MRVHAERKVGWTNGKLAVNITRYMALSAGKGWRGVVITGNCTAGLGKSLAITSSGALKLQIAPVSRQSMLAAADCSY